MNKADVILSEIDERDEIVREFNDLFYMIRELTNRAGNYELLLSNQEAQLRRMEQDVYKLYVDVHERAAKMKYDAKVREYLGIED